MAQIYCRTWGELTLSDKRGTGHQSRARLMQRAYIRLHSRSWREKENQCAIKTYVAKNIVVHIVHMYNDIGGTS